VRIEPGTTVLVLIPAGATSSASDCMNPIRPNFDAAYAARFGYPCLPAPEATAMIAPPPRRRIGPITARAQRNTPVRFVASVASQSANAYC
jgi:hypothetical protein